MTFFHFINCVAVSYVPYVLIYRTSGLQEYSVFWKCIQAGAAYLFTQLCKMLILATFFPVYDSSSSFDFVGEIMKCTIDIADLVGLHLVMTKLVAKGQMKFLVAGLGWAGAELLVTRFLPLWVGARGVEFDWKYMQMSLESNINLIQNVVVATLVWLYSRNYLHKALLPLVVAFLCLSIYRPIVIQILIQCFNLGSWNLLLAKALLTLSMGLFTLEIYLTQTTESNSYH